MRTLSLLALATAGLAATPLMADAHREATDGPAEVSLSADELLAPFYTKLQETTALPVAGANPSLPGDTTLTRIAFGSCNHQSRSQHMWAQIASQNPQMFLFIGDNNYGDQNWNGDAALTTLRTAYETMAATPELTGFRADVPMMVTWDDHDFAFNDGGANFAFRQWSETIFETFWNSTDEVRSRPGVYESRMFGADGQRTQIIILDTRYFRSDFEAMPYSTERPPLGPYVPSNDPTKTMLGDAQWEWLQAELAKPADLRIVVSSIQVLTDAHNYEAWESLPLERAKLYAMLADREESGMVMLSGDRHAGGVYSETLPGADEALWELTSSSLNYSFSSTEANTAREPDDKRLTDFISEENYGMVDIDWAAQQVTLRLLGSESQTYATQTFGW